MGLDRPAGGKCGWLRSAAWGLTSLAILPGCLPVELSKFVVAPATNVPPVDAVAPPPVEALSAQDNAPVSAPVPPQTTRPTVGDPRPLPTVPQSPVVAPLPSPASKGVPAREEASNKLDVPDGLPFPDAPLPSLPPDTPATRADRDRAVVALFPPLPDLGNDPMPEPDAAGGLTLEQLVRQAVSANPNVRQAAADVEDARGRWVQAGLCPNPTVGYQGDQIANAGSAGQQGGFINQTIVTAGKLKLAQAAAYFEFVSFQLRLRRAEVDVTRQVRADYFATLVAAEQVRLTRLMVEFVEQAYRREVAMVRGGQAAAFEAMALRAIVTQQRTTLVVARNRYVSAWKQLAATLNAPHLPPTPLAGQATERLPQYRHDALLARTLAAHTDFGIARTQVAQAQYRLQLERNRPIPDLENNLYFQRDTQMHSFQFGYQLGVQVPVWNRNQGTIASAQAQLVRANAEADRARVDLTRQLADAFERYQTNRQQLALYRGQIMPDLVRAFRGVFQRYQVEPDKVNYNDIVTAQQNLTTAMSMYLTLLTNQWQAVADIGGVAQLDDLYDATVTAPADAPADTGWPDALAGTPDKK